MNNLAVDEGSLGQTSPGRLAHARAAFVVRVFAVATLYYLATLLGKTLILPASYISILWPPNTILLLTLLLAPPRHWAWYLGGVLPAHLVAQAQYDVPLSTGLIYYAFDCMLVILTAGVMRRIGLSRLTLSDLRETAIFVLATTVVVALASFVWSPLIASQLIGGDLRAQWLGVFLSNYLPFLIAVPPLAIASTRGPEIIRNARGARYTEFALLAVGLLAAVIGLFGLELPATAHQPALFYAPLPFLLWAAVRFGPGGLSFSFLIFALMAIFSVVAGRGVLAAQYVGGEVHWLQIYLLALYVPLLALASVFEELGARSEALRESEARYRGVVEDQTELICRFLPGGRYTFVNGAYCRYFQTTPERLIGRSFWTFIPAEWHEACAAHLGALTPEHPVATIEHEVLAPSGEIRWQQWRDRGLFDAHGRIVEYQSVGRDITDRKRAEYATQKLAHAGRLAVLGEMTGSIAHEINQPLGAILSNAEAAEMLLDSDTPPLGEVRNILADIRKDDLRASEVIRRVRALLNKRELTMVECDLNEVMDEVVHLIATDARWRKVTLDVDFTREISAIRGDRVQLQQVLLNLILNGMEAMVDTPENARRIVLRTQIDGDRNLVVSVSDAGHGIAADKLPSVFNSFFTTKKDGMGLGLAIARSIVDVHGGRIWASNNPDGGATFSFTLPVRAPNAVH
jgi:PAS domain S-box-containing protein